MSSRSMAAAWPPVLEIGHSAELRPALHHYLIVLRFHSLGLWSLCISGWLLAAAVAPAAEFTLEALPARVRAANPTLAAARWRIEEAKGRLLAAGRRANPEVGFEQQRNVRGREFSAGVSLEQKFPLTAKLRLEKEVSAAEVWQAEAEVREVERALVARAQEAAVKWLALSAQTELRREQADNALALAAFIEERVKQGEGSTLDAGTVRLEVGQHRYEISRLAAEQAQYEGELRPLLGLPPAEMVGITGRLADPAGAGAPPGVRVEQRPDYQVLERAQEAAERAVDLEKSRRWEDLTVGIAAEFERGEDAPEGLQNDGFLGLRVSVPLPWWNKNEGKIHEAEARAARLAKERVALAATIRAEAAAARSDMRERARLAVEEAGALLTLATEQHQRVQAAYEQGLAPMTDVLRARDQLLATRSARLEAVRDYHLARLRLETATARHVSSLPSSLAEPPPKPPPVKKVPSRSKKPSPAKP